jgi:aspartyl-tRNA(Asn)/glutamyl-tRNA(Gln) amidotransferase subunit A
MSSLLKLNFHELRQHLSKKEISVTDVVNTYIKRAEDTSELNAYVLDTFDQAKDQAKKADSRYQKGEARALEGLPLATKDIFCTKDVLTTCCSRILEDFIPTYESTVTDNLNHAGAISLGKANLDEFAMGSSTSTSSFGPSINPYKKKGDDANLTPGGSSGGSSASVAAGSSLAALGSDTGGSIRQPAAYCGLVGIKPTYGLCSRYGIMAFASSLDQAGPLTRTVKDSALVLEHMAGHDAKDSTSINKPVPCYEKALTGNVRGLKIGIPKEYNLPGLNPDLQRLWEKSATWFKEMGAEIIDISLPHTEYGLPVYYIVNPSEASSNFARYDGVRYGLRVNGKSLGDMYEKTRTAGFGDEVKRRILIGTHALSAGCYEEYYLRAQKVRRKIFEDFKQAFTQVDFILTPTTASDAFALDDPSMDPMAMYLEDVFTVAANLAGLPAISVPSGFSEKGLPLGMQLIGPALSEEKLFNAAFALETAAQFKHKIIEAL